MNLVSTYYLNQTTASARLERDSKRDVVVDTDRMRGLNVNTSGPLPPTACFVPAIRLSAVGRHTFHVTAARA